MQEELLEVVAHEYRRRDLPLSAILCDFFHWPKMRDWDFEHAEWPDPAAMVEELGALGQRIRRSGRGPRPPTAESCDGRTRTTPASGGLQRLHNTLMGDPTTERLLPLIDAAAEAGAEYFVIDAGWYVGEEGTCCQVEFPER